MVGQGRVLEVNAAVQGFWVQALLGEGGERARGYLSSRGFDEGDWVAAGCGFAPDGWTKTLGGLVREGFTISEVAAAGLTRTGTHGEVDRFKGRIMWPIRSPQGVVLGFTGRVLPGDESMKYLNTPTSAVYRKDVELYRPEGPVDYARVAVVEGPTDAMAVRKAGVTVVASCWTSFGAGHLGRLRRFERVVHTFDGDDAGRKAQERVMEFAGAALPRQYVATLPDGADPGSMDTAELRAVLDEPTPLFEAVVRRYATGEIEQDHHVVRHATRYIGQVRDPADRAAMLDILAEVTVWDRGDVSTIVADKLAEDARAPKPVRRRQVEHDHSLSRTVGG